MGINRCINCEEEVQGNFCQNCGQKATVKRISIKTFFQDYLSRLFGMDTNLLRTIRDLTIRPGKVGRSFIAGNRVQYIGPVGYFFLVLTALLITFSLLNINMQDFVDSSSQLFAPNAPSETLVPNTLSKDGGKTVVEFQKEMAEVMNKNMKLLHFFAVPFFAFWSLLFYRKSDMNILEHGVNAFYVLGHSTFLTIIAATVYKYFAINLLGVVIIPRTIYYAWATMGFYQKNGLLAFVKNLFLFLVATLSFGIIVAIYALIFVL